MVSDNSLLFSSNRSPKFSNSFTSDRIFSDVAGDITIVVDGESFLLHKFPLAAWSGKIRKLVAEGPSRIELTGLPGGPRSFELAAKFCYGVDFEVTAANAAPLRCAAEYLEMSEEIRGDNLLRRADEYLSEVAARSLEKSVEVLLTCQALPEAGEIVGRFVDAVAANARDEEEGGRRWWPEDLTGLGIGVFERVVCAMARAGVGLESVVAAVIRYAEVALGRAPGPGDRAMVEALAGLIPPEKVVVGGGGTVPLGFLFRLLRAAAATGAAADTRLGLERRVAARLETVSLDDLLMPSPAGPAGGLLFDVDAVRRMLVGFLQRIDDEEAAAEGIGGYESEGVDSSYRHGALLKVGRLVDAYLAEIAPDPHLGLQKFAALIELLPDYARVVDDDLYRAVDIYLKAHPMLTEVECKKVCKLIDCGKLSQEACNHAAQNDLLGDLGPSHPKS